MKYSIVKIITLCLMSSYIWAGVAVCKETDEGCGPTKIVGVAAKVVKENNSADE